MNNWKKINHRNLKKSGQQRSFAEAKSFFFLKKKKKHTFSYNN